MLTVRTSENTVITSFRLISERQDFSSVRTGENTVRARARIQLLRNQEDRLVQRHTSAWKGTISLLYPRLLRQAKRGERNPKHDRVSGEL